MGYFGAIILWQPSDQRSCFWLQERSLCLSSASLILVDYFIMSVICSVYCVIWSGYCGEGRKEWHSWHWQEEVGTWSLVALIGIVNIFNLGHMQMLQCLQHQVFVVDLWCCVVQVSGASRFDCRPVCLCHSKAYQAEFREGYLHICQERSPPNRCFTLLAFGIFNALSRMSSYTRLM
jgi:hypothetical protein